MPIVVKDFSWEETESWVNITVPLKGVHMKKLDVFMTDIYIKANFSPFFFECFLLDKIDHKKSVTHVGEGKVFFQLFKETAVLWNKLQSDVIGDKNAMRTIRKEAIEQAQKEAEENKKKNKEAKRKSEKSALRKVMSLEDKDKQKIKEIKEAEKKKAMEELQEWKEEQQILAEKEKQKILQEQKKKKKKPVQKEKFIIQEPKKDLAMTTPLRQAGNIEVNFTPRVFPTPNRESQKKDEDEWLRKQAEARRMNNIIDEDLSEEEKNPDWLLDKGNEFFQAGNYAAAINAYTHGIRLNNKLPALYSNRAACHLKIKNLMKCIKDCSTALDLMFPCVPLNAKSRYRALIRRGTAFCEMELYVEGLQDYEAAIRIDGNNKKLQEDVENIRNIIQGTN